MFFFWGPNHSFLKIQRYKSVHVALCPGAAALWWLFWWEVPHCSQWLFLTRFLCIQMEAIPGHSLNTNLKSLKDIKVEDVFKYVYILLNTITVSREKSYESGQSCYTNTVQSRASPYTACQNVSNTEVHGRRKTRYWVWIPASIWHSGRRNNIQAHCQCGSHTGSSC